MGLCRSVVHWPRAAVDTSPASIWKTREQCTATLIRSRGWSTCHLLDVSPPGKPLRCGGSGEPGAGAGRPRPKPCSHSHLPFRVTRPFVLLRRFRGGLYRRLLSIPFQLRLVCCFSGVEGRRASCWFSVREPWASCWPTLTCSLDSSACFFWGGGRGSYRRGVGQRKRYAGRCPLDVGGSFLVHRLLVCRDH